MTHLKYCRLKLLFSLCSGTLQAQRRFSHIAYRNCGATVCRFSTTRVCRWHTSPMKWRMLFRFSKWVAL